MPVKTKSIYEPAAPEDGVRVLVTRYYPRGVKKDRFDEWVKPLSPSKDLLSSYKKGEKDWEAFKRGFLAEMKSSPESLEALRRIRDLSETRDVTLLCYEKTGLPCHRLLVQEVLTNSRLASARRTGGAASSRIRFYSRRKVARKATK